MKKIRQFILTAISLVLVAAQFMGAVVYATDGDLDSSFGNGGRVVLDPQILGRSYGIAVQTDGKIITLGVAQGSYRLLRLMPDGTIDITFGNNGIAIVGIDSSSAPMALVLQPDGKIIVTSQSGTARLNSDGTPDTAFGDNGIVSDGAADLALQPDGKILLARGSSAVMRLLQDGSIDTSFGDEGLVNTDFYVTKIKVQSNGGIVAAGSSQIERFTTSGELDAGFGDGGVVTLDTGYVQDTKDLVISSDDGIVVVGNNSWDGGGFTVYRPYLAKFDSSGNVDTTFGDGGITGTSYENKTILSAELQSDGKILAVGRTMSGDTSTAFVVMRFLPDGQIDDSYGASGLVMTSFSDLGGSALTVGGSALQPDGKLVAAYWFARPGQRPTALVRYDSTPPDTTAPTVSSPSWTSNPLQQGQDTSLSTTATDNTVVQKVEYTIDGGARQPMTYNATTGKWEATFGSNLAVNTYNIQVIATDGAGNESTPSQDVLAVYNATNGYVTGHSKLQPGTTDTLPIALDTGNNPAKLVIGLTNIKAATSTAPTSGSFDMQYIVKNNKDEFNVSSTGVDWLVVPDSTHASLQGKATLTTYVNGVMTVHQNVTVRFDMNLGTPDHMTVKIYDTNVDPATSAPTWQIDQNAVQSQLMIKP